MKLAKLAIAVALCGTALCATTGPAQAQGFPEHPVTIVVGFPPGTSTDSVARIIGDKLSKEWGQPIIVENKPGVGGSLAVAQVKRAKPDGYTLVLSATAPMNINPYVYKQLNYDPLKDFEFIGQTTWLPYMLVTNKQKGLDSLKKIIDYAHQHPGGLTFASIGTGTTSHLLMAMLMKKTDTKMTHVPYKGSSQAQTDVIAGNVDMTFDTVVSTLPHIKAGRLQAIAVSTSTRAQLAPDVPTLEELGIKDFNMGAWLGFFAPKGTPRDIIEKIHTDLNRTLADPAVHKKLVALGSEVVSSPSTQAFRQMVETNYKMWGDLVKTAGVTQK
ncbi:tripartite tricarboxylate transporter substrate binding protein [Candidimonas humi]|jgi:tripartite-type tricarboxylate transporter receptor subunit TctC|uniref:Bug family tripartite tricarboxylate transporter substrate binding protein n=1 Tax=Candidimonas humi TaxID=683355 RepID=A0ABV8P036_9BURK|nr:tripartite tricarboxylate transporter substrate binding protein [Candidimonas humi]MBV6303993.1 tripartite tricarboxylate transporter substrate binding protein [Candidimonas humi]